ncbi:MAG: type II toxin-antitoxin system VapC family toxin [Bacteroidales bacterium]|nr:type II toxin-antitoxin system VapC family toxin [Bacteroidales bacterium]
MRLLLDTNIVIFWASDREQLDRDVEALLRDYDNQLYISAESIRELIVAYRNKGLGTKEWPSEEAMIDAIEQKYDIKILPVKREHMRTYAKMQINEAQGHKDPSDHVIIAHAITEKLTLISSDTRFPFYRSQGLDLIQNHR